MRKQETFQSSEFLTYFMWDINPFNSQNMGKMSSHSKGNGKNMEKHKYFKVKGS